jgi:hypothetical protein
MLVDTETPLIMKILEIDADTVQSGTGTLRTKLQITVVAPERGDAPGGGRYSINIAEDAAKELAGRISHFSEREQK